MSTDEYRRQYQDHPFNSFEVRYRTEWILQCLQRFPHQRILEIGCAEDSIFNHLGRYEKLVVVEPNIDFCKLLRVQVGSTENVKVINAYFEDAASELEKEKFDFILVSSLLHELKDPAPFLSCLEKACSPDTVLHCNVPNARSFHRMLALECGLIDSLYQRSANQIRFEQPATFDVETLTALLEANGFQVFESGSYFFKPFTHRQMADLVESKILSPEVVDGLSRMTKYLPEIGAEIYVHAKRGSN